MCVCVCWTKCEFSNMDCVCFAWHICFMLKTIAVNAAIVFVVDFSEQEHARKQKDLSALTMFLFCFFENGLYMFCVACMIFASDADITICDSSPFHF